MRMDELTIYRGKTALISSLIPPDRDLRWTAGPGMPLKEVTSWELLRSKPDTPEMIRRVLYGLGWLSAAVGRGPDREMIDDFTERLAGLAERLQAAEGDEDDRTD